MVYPPLAKRKVLLEGAEQSFRSMSEERAGIRRALSLLWREQYRALQRIAPAEKDPCKPQSGMGRICRNILVAYSGIQRDILSGVLTEASSYRSCKVREMHFRRASADAVTAYSDSGVAMDPIPDGWRKIGVLQDIVRVTVSSFNKFTF